MTEYVSIRKEDWEFMINLLRIGLEVLKKAVVTEFEGNRQNEVIK